MMQVNRDAERTHVPTVTQELVEAGNVQRCGKAAMAKVWMNEEHSWDKQLLVRIEGEHVVRQFELTPGSWGSLSGSVRLVGNGLVPPRETSRSAERELTRLREELDAAYRVVADLAGVSLLAAQQLVRVDLEQTAGGDDE